MSWEKASVALILSALYFVDVVISASLYYILYMAGTGMKCLLFAASLLAVLTVVAALEER